MCVYLISCGCRYPHLTGQVECPNKMSMKDLESGHHCFEDEYEIVPNMVYKSEGKSMLTMHKVSHSIRCLIYLCPSMYVSTNGRQSLSSEAVGESLPRRYSFPHRAMVVSFQLPVVCRRYVCQVSLRPALSQQESRPNRSSTWTVLWIFAIFR